LVYGLVVDLLVGLAVGLVADWAKLYFQI